MTLKIGIMNSENSVLLSNEKNKYRMNEKSDLLYPYRAREDENTLI